MNNEKKQGEELARELYAVLQVSPEATDEEIRKAYRYWAQVYHPDKYQDLHMKDVATENFRRIGEAHEVLSDVYKREVYDLYGMEGLKSGLELGPHLDRAERLKEELERLRRLKEQEKLASLFRSAGTILTHLSYPDYVARDGLLKGMAMSSEFHSQLSKNSTLAVVGNLEVKETAGEAEATAVLMHQLSPSSSIECIATAGLRALVGLQATRNLSIHSTATISIAKSLRDGSINLSNTWNRQISETTVGNIRLVLGSESSVAVGWQKKDEKMSAAGELQIGPSSFGATARYTYHFSLKSHGRIAGRFGSNAMEVEIGGGRKISDFGSVRMIYLIGIQGILWRFELQRGGQKFIVPLLLSRDLNPVFAAGAFFIPTSFYFLLKKFIFKPYLLRREKQRALEDREKTFAQVREAKAGATKTQKLLQIVANRKKNSQVEKNGVVIELAMYGSFQALQRVKSGENSSDLDAIDVTVPLNFLLNDMGQLKLHENVKKSGIMGFCDPCPAEAKHLLVKYSCAGQSFEVIVDDYAELSIPQEAHRV